MTKLILLLNLVCCLWFRVYGLGFMDCCLWFRVEMCVSIFVITDCFYLINVLAFVFIGVLVVFF